MDVWSTLVAAAGLLVVLAVPRLMCVVPSDHARNVERFGRYHRTLLRPGRHFLIPYLDLARKPIDLREQTVPMPTEPVITADDVVVDIDTVLRLQITDPRAAAYETVDYVASVGSLVTLALRNLGAVNGERALVSARDTLGGQVREALDGRTGRWGVRVNDVEITAIGPPYSIEEAKRRWQRAHGAPPS
jgi:regulator of protease activity HflC (stomatin/prohibitin superfamily)